MPDRLAKYWFERLRASPSISISPRKFRSPRGADGEGRARDLRLAIGETADTLASLRYAKEHGQHTLAIVNVPSSTIARESETVIPTLAGPEIGVASTKAFTCQLAALACLAVARRPRARYAFRG